LNIKFQSLDIEKMTISFFQSKREMYSLKGKAIYFYLYRPFLNTIYFFLGGTARQKQIFYMVGRPIEFLKFWGPNIKALNNITLRTPWF